MKRYQYRALALDGRETAGEEEARHLNGLTEQLSVRGLLLVEAKALGEMEQGLKTWFSLAVNPAEVTRFLSDLSLLLQTGQPIDEALRLLAHDMRGSLGRIAESLHTDLLKGTTFVEALSRHPEVFPAQLLALVRVSEATGRLNQAIEVATDQRHRQSALTEKLTGALRYPAFLFCAAFAVLGFFLLYVMPQFSAVLRDAGSNAGGAISFLMNASDTLRSHLDLFASGLALLLLCGLLAARSQVMRQRTMTFLVKLPIIRGTVEMHRAALFCMTLGALLRQDVSVPAALKVLEQILGGEPAASLSVIGDSVRRGGALGDALAAHPFLPEIARRMLKIGEESGELAEVSTRAGVLYEKKLQLRLDTITGIVGPAAVIAISSMIGGLMVTIMTAMISVNQLVF